MLTTVAVLILSPSVDIDGFRVGGHFPDHMCDGDEEGAIP